MNISSLRSITSAAEWSRRASIAIQTAVSSPHDWNGIALSSTAVVATHHGGPEVLEVRAFEVAAPRPGEAFGFDVVRSQRR